MNPIAQMPEEENPDYDIFASVRPTRATVDDNVSDEDELDEDDVDVFADARPKEQEIEEIRREKSKPKRNLTGQEVAKDAAKQFTKETLIGLGGTWGDLAELAGLPTGQLPGGKEKNKREFDVLTKMKEPGYKPDPYDIATLTDDSEGNPTWPLPTSQGLRKLNEMSGGPGEAESALGRYAGRTGKFLGSGAAFGQAGILPAILAGTAGQTAEEAGFGPLVQMAAEIVSLIFSPGQGPKNLAGARKKEVQQKIAELRDLGYAEQDITLAINHASKGRKGGVKASKSQKTEKAFEDFAERSDQMVSDILTSEIPGIERGTQHVHQMASDAYGAVAARGRNMVIRDSTPFINSATGVVRELRRNLGRNPEAETFLNRLHDAVVASTQNPTAENFMNFYKELNKAGNWMGRSQKDRLITQVKEGIKDTFRSEGRAGRQLADDFETVNRGIRNAYQAEEVHTLLQKAATQDGLDYKKLNKLFDNADNVQLFEEVLGPVQTRNLEIISKTGREVQNFDKAWKATHLLQGNQMLDIARGAGAGYYLWKGDMEGLAMVLASKGMGVASKKIAEKMLTDPKFQNLFIKGVHSLKNESPKLFRSANDAMQKYLDDEGIKIKLD